MKNKDAFTKILAIVGTVLVWIPILKPIEYSVAAIFKRDIVWLDFLMPAELFLMMLVGGGLLIWAALRRRSRLRLISWCLGIAASLLFEGYGLSVLPGLISGETEPAGWWQALSYAAITLYSVGLVLMGVGGVLLLLDLPKPSRPSREGL